MTSKIAPSSSAPTASRGAVWAARGIAVVSALFWGVLFFGIVDLGTVLLQDERFHEHYLVEAGWGLLYTVLVMLPLLVWAVSVRSVVLLQQLLATAAAVLVAGLAGAALGQVLPAVFLALSAWVPAILARRSLSLPRVSVAQTHPLLAALAGVALVGAVAYAVVVLRASYARVPDDNTWGLLHLPMQAGLGLAIATTTAVVALAQAAGRERWRVGTVFPAVAAGALGAFSLAYPDHLASLGTVGGALALAWTVALLASGLVVRDRATG